MLSSKFESVVKKGQKVHPQEVIGRTLLHTVIKVKAPVFCHIFANKFFHRVFLNFSILHFCKKMFVVLLTQI
jgi:hypothetical protein